MQGGAGISPRGKQDTGWFLRGLFSVSVVEPFRIWILPQGLELGPHWFHSMTEIALCFRPEPLAVSGLSLPPSLP